MIFVFPTLVEISSGLASTINIANPQLKLETQVELPLASRSTPRFRGFVHRLKRMWGMFGRSNASTCQSMGKLILGFGGMACIFPSTYDNHIPPQPALSCDYMVIGRDAPDVGRTLQKLATEHWDYIDRFASNLVARGPMLSVNGDEHTGSVHVLKVASRADALRFADEEPYRRANVYSRVTVTRFENVLGQSMWERPPVTPPQRSTLLLADWPPQSISWTQIERLRAAASSEKHWVFLGLLLSEEGNCVGIAGAADLGPDAAEHALRRILVPLGLRPGTIECHRWKRGGRQR